MTTQINPDRRVAQIDRRDAPQGSAPPAAQDIESARRDTQISGPEHAEREYCRACPCDAPGEKAQLLAWPRNARGHSNADAERYCNRILPRPSLGFREQQQERHRLARRRRSREKVSKLPSSPNDLDPSARRWRCLDDRVWSVSPKAPDHQSSGNDPEDQSQRILHRDHTKSQQHRNAWQHHQHIWHSEKRKLAPCDKLILHHTHRPVIARTGREAHDITRLPPRRLTRRLGVVDRFARHRSLPRTVTRCVDTPAPPLAAHSRRASRPRAAARSPDRIRMPDRHQVETPRHDRCGSRR